MALVLADRVQESTTTTGTGSVTLGGAVTGYQSFAVIGNGNTTFYCIADQGGSNWEVGVGTYSTTGPTLARTTVLASSNSGSLVSFTSGTKSVFVTYPSEKSVNLDASGNVSALGTVSSGVWQGTTVAVAYGGTGVTASSGANSVVLRDSNANITTNNTFNGYTAVTAAAGTTTLTAASTFYQKLTGTTTQTFKLPDATTLPQGATFIFDNDSTGLLTITDNAGTTIDTVPTGCANYMFLEANGTSAGSWSNYAFIPDTYDFSTTSASFGNATITNAVWNGTTIASGYGGTGLTTFAGANNALYSTSSSALAAGTLPVAAGGTGSTTLTANNVLLGNGTSALQVVAPGTSGNILTSNGTTWTSSAPATPAAAGSNTQVQYNNSGALGASSSFTFASGTGALRVPEVEASNGIIVNNQTVGTSYSIPSGYSASSAGPISIAGGVTVTVPSGSRWVVI